VSRMELRIICYDLNAGKYRVVAISQADNIYFSVRKRRTHSQVRFTKKRICVTDVLSAVCHSSIFSCIRHSLHNFFCYCMRPVKRDS